MENKNINKLRSAGENIREVIQDLEEEKAKDKNDSKKEELKVDEKEKKAKAKNPKKKAEKPKNPKKKAKAKKPEPKMAIVVASSGLAGYVAGILFAKFF